MLTIDRITTAEQLLASNLPRCELVGGELMMMSPAGFDHGRFASKIVAALENHVTPRSLGIVTTAEAGFQLSHDPDTVRAPDAAFVRSDRIPSGGVRGFFQGAPDIAVEVVSPTDRPAEIVAKVRDWLQGGCFMVWVVDPESQSITVHGGDQVITVFESGDRLTGGTVLPDFTMAVAKVFS
jgi:Uma2 family endonuclease